VNCQHCGSASRSDWGYECGSSSSVGFERSIRCRTKEISNIRQELEESNNRIKRLEEAGDAILNANNDDEEYEAIKHWNQAKEAKL
jgi:hypothetical protein